MVEIYNQIVAAKAKNEKLLALLLDPDKLEINSVFFICEKIKKSPATHVFIGGSSFEGNYLDDLIVEIKRYLEIPIVLFPGNPSQISAQADGILFLMLLSGRNPDYLIEYQVNAVLILEKTNLEIISTGYILVESGTKTAVERVSKTKPLPRKNIEYVAQTAKAGEYIGNKLIYLEAGSGAKNPIPLEMIAVVAKKVSVPLIVGGGIRSTKQIDDAFENGATMVVIGTAFENDVNFFK